MPTTVIGATSLGYLTNTNNHRDGRSFAIWCW